MALRFLLGKAKPWSWSHHQLVKNKFGFLGAIGSNSSDVGQHFLLNTQLLPVLLNQSCRHYFLPPPPPVETVDASEIITSNNIRARIDGPIVLSAAEFAVKTLNEAQDRNIRLVRVVRASWKRNVGRWHALYITLEGIDEEGELNVYYALVLDKFDYYTVYYKRLMKWVLVDESFSYPFVEISSSKRLVESWKRSHEAANNHVVGDLLKEMTWESKDFKCHHLIPESRRVNLLEQIHDLEENLCVTDFCPWWEPKSDVYRLSTIGSDAFVPVYAIEVEKKVNAYALFAVKTRNNNEDGKICLEEVWCAIKTEVDGRVFYFLLMEAKDEMDKLNFYYAIVEVQNPVEGRVLMWKMVNEFCSIFFEKDMVINTWFESWEKDSRTKYKMIDERQFREDMGDELFSHSFEQHIVINTWVESWMTVG